MADERSAAPDLTICSSLRAAVQRPTPQVSAISTVVAHPSGARRGSGGANASASAAAAALTVGVGRGL